MRPDAIPVKTELGRHALRQRGFAGSRAQRALLIMVDGHASVARLSATMAPLGLCSADLLQLEQAGLVAWVGLDHGAEPKPAASGTPIDLLL